MKINKWIAKLALAGMLIIFQSGVYAAEQNKKWHVGVSLGASESDDSAKLIDNSFAAGGITTTTVDFDDTDSSLGVYAGIRVSTNMGFEVGYTNFGKYAYSGTGTAGAYSGDIEITGFYGAIVGYFPLSETISLFGKFGMAIWDKEGSISNAAMQSADFVNGSNGKDRLFGFGAEYKVTDSLSFRGGLMQLKASKNIQMWTMSAQYHF